MTHTEQQTKPAVDSNIEELAEIRTGLMLEFEHSAKWRVRKSSEYEKDDRNLRAAQILTRLAVDVVNIPDALLRRYDEVLELQATDEPHDFYLRAIGFKFAPTTAAEFVEAFIKDPKQFLPRKWNTI